MLKQIKKGATFYPIIDTGEYTDKDKLSVQITDANGNSIENTANSSFKNLTKDIESHTGTTDGLTDAGSSTIALESGNTLEVGDLFIHEDHGYRVTATTDTSIDIEEPLIVKVADGVDLNNTGNLTSYAVNVATDSLGIFDVVISHPEMDDVVQRYEIVEKTIEEMIAEGNAGSRKMVAVA